MLEWIQYQISPGEDGGNHFDYELRKKFDKIDVGKTGKLSVNDFQLFLENNFSDLISLIDVDRRPEVKAIIVELAEECISLLFDAAG